MRGQTGSGTIDWAGVSSWLSAASGMAFSPAPAGEVAGGHRHRGLRWNTDSGPTYVKLASPGQQAAFEAEADGLRELAAAGAVRVPRVFAAGGDDRHAVLAMEWFDLAPGGGAPRAEARLGEQLAMLHRTSAARFGWHRDNTLGATPQPNAWLDDWPRFFVERRLGFQLELAAQTTDLDRGVIERGRRLCEYCGAFFSSYRPVPSLLHGDLWGGNWGIDAATGDPVIFDPAVYFGDRETDLAMTRLFGGFGSAFYAAYQSAWPLDQAAGTRRTLYNLYHVLNHWNLFRGGYGRQAADMIDRLLAEFG